MSFCPQGEGSLYNVTSCLAVWSDVPSGGLCLWSHVPSGGGGLCPGRLSLGALHPGDLCLGVSVQGVSVRETPPCGEEWVLRILLEGILVLSNITQSICTMDLLPSTFWQTKLTPKFLFFS